MNIDLIDMHLEEDAAHDQKKKKIIHPKPD
jgi:hypothetical protein